MIRIRKELAQRSNLQLKLQEKGAFFVAELSEKSTTQETTRESVLRLLRGKPDLTRKELATQLNRSENTIKEHLAKLKEDGTLARVGSTKNGKWKVNN